jgi:formylglycine-generating enzyme required for sulfatase activity/nucleoside phosphorylase
MRDGGERTMNVAEFKGRVDFGIITIREDEMKAVLARFPHVIGTVSGRREYNLRCLAPGDPYTVAIVRSAGQGTGEAQQVANHLLDELDPRWLLVAGIAGGAPAYEHTLGDVVVSTEVASFSVGAALQGGAHEYALQGWVNHPEARKRAANLPALDGLGAWNSPQSIAVPRPAVNLSPENLYGNDAWKAKVAHTLQHHVARGRQEPVVTAGAIACSDLVMKDAELLSVWLKIARQVIAIEMESAGVHRAAHDRQVPFLSIRGLSDVVGLKRDHAWTEYACHSAAAFMRAFLLTHPISPCEPLARPRRSRATEQPRGAPSDPLLPMKGRLRSWLPALRGKRESGLPLDEALKALYRSIAPVLRPTPHWLEVLDHYVKEPALPAELPKDEEYAIRELRNLGLLTHDGSSLFTPARSTNLRATRPGAVIAALRADGSIAPYRLARGLVRDLAALDDAALDLLEEINASGRIPDGAVDQARHLRSQCLINQAEYFLGNSNYAALTQLGLFVLQWRRGTIESRDDAPPARTPRGTAPPMSRGGKPTRWTGRAALADTMTILLEREFKALTANVSRLQRRFKPDSQEAKVFQRLLSQLVVDEDSTETRDPMAMRAHDLLRHLERYLFPAQLTDAEHLVNESVSAARSKHSGAEHAAIEAWRGETRRQHERLIPFFPDEIGELLDRVYVEVYVDASADLQLPRVTTLFELLSDTFQTTAHSEPALPVEDRRTARPALEETTSREAGRWVIMGDPGSGKTTLARHVAWRFADAPDGPIPVYLSLSRLIRSGKHPFEQAELELTAAIGPTGRGLCDGLFRAAKRTGGVCMMLDGLDEVPPDSIDNLGDLIRSWAHKLPYVAIALLTRPIGYQTLAPMFRHARVRPLGAAAQQELLKRWCEPEVADRTWRRLHEPGSRLRMIISNPLMLTLVAILAREQDVLPLNRVQLYAQAIDLLLRRGHCAERRGVKDSIAARRILGSLSWVLQQRPLETWSMPDLHAAIVQLCASAPQSQALLKPWGSPESFLNDIARNSGVLGPHDGPREPWRYLHRSLREFLVAETLCARLTASDEHSAANATVEELAGIGGASVGRWAEPLSLLCGLVPQPMGLLKRVREVNPSLAWRAILNADTIDPFDTARFISGDEWQNHIKQIAKTWIATQEEDDFKRAKELLWLMIGPSRSVKDVAVIYQTLEELGLPPDREAFFSRAGRWPARGEPLVESLSMIRLPGGGFTMGVCHPALVCPWDGTPSDHIVEPFEISSTPITLRQYLEFDPTAATAHSEHTRPEALDAPVTGLSWQEAYLFARWLDCDLPTEVEWEYACRAGTTTTFCSGDTEEDLGRVGWFNGNSEGKIQPVGRKLPSPFGLYDMHGNVWEWCTDWSIPPGSTDPEDSTREQGGWRVLRGGSWFNEARRARSAERSRWPSNAGYELVGFRIIRR